MTAIVELLFDRPGHAADEIRRLLDERAGPLDLVSYGLRNATRQVAQAVAGFLDMPIGNFVFHAWDRHQAIKNACAQTVGQPGGLAIVAVADHTLETQQRPRVQVDMGGQHIQVLDLVLSLTLDIESVVVTVYEGRVTGCQSGAASATAELGVARPGGDSYPLIRRNLPRVSLHPHPHADVPAAV